MVPGHCTTLSEHVISMKTSYFNIDFALQMKLTKFPLIHCSVIVAWGSSFRQVFSVARNVCLYLINPVTVDWTVRSGTPSFWHLLCNTKAYRSGINVSRYNQEKHPGWPHKKNFCSPKNKNNTKPKWRNYSQVWRIYQPEIMYRVFLEHKDAKIAKFIFVLP